MKKRQIKTFTVLKIIKSKIVSLESGITKILGGDGGSVQNPSKTTTNSWLCHN